MELRLLSLGFEGLCRGKNYISPGALLADVESEYFPVHLWLYSHQYAYYYYCHEERYTERSERWRTKASARPRGIPQMLVDQRAGFIRLHPLGRPTSTRGPRG